MTDIETTLDDQDAAIAEAAARYEEPVPVEITEGQLVVAMDELARAEKLEGDDKHQERNRLEREANSRAIYILEHANTLSPELVAQAEQVMTACYRFRQEVLFREHPATAESVLNSINLNDVRPGEDIGVATTEYTYMLARLNFARDQATSDRERLRIDAAAAEIQDRRKKLLSSDNQ